MISLKNLGFAFAGVVAVIAMVLVFKSPQSHMQRSVVIQAPPASVYQQLISFKNFNAWSPWAKLDPNTRYTYEGPESGVGARMSWVSENPNVGAGSQWIVEAVENKMVKNGMAFGDMKGDYFATLELEEVPEGTKVTWHYDGDVKGTGMVNSALGKAFGLFIDRALGPFYEDGLTSLKQVVESQPVTVDSLNK
ncbi:MAG: SRPBCC family protein [Cyclobacteriaceae bacterium]